MNHSIDSFFDIFWEGLLKGFATDEYFWNMLIKYSVLDWIIAEELIPTLLPENLHKSYFEAYKRLRLIS